MIDGSGTTTYTYDSQDRLTSKATPEGTLSYTYDAAGNVASMASSNPNGVSVSYTYDDVGRLSTVVDNRLASGSNTTYTYDPASNLATAAYPNGLHSTFTYDQLDRLTALSTPVSSYTYQLGPTGNRTGATEGTGRTLTWTYDGIYRLTNESIGSAPSGKDGSISYGLDPVGNRSSESSTLSGLDPGTFTYNSDDEVSTDTFDNNGNTTATGGKTFAFDSENHLVSMGSTVGLLYDGDGNRVAKTANGVTTRYLVDDLNPTGYPQVVEELVGGSVERTYAYGLQRISENQVISNTWTPSFYETDGEGSVRQLTDAAGAVTDSYDYDAFGNKINSTGTTPNNYLYRSEQYDPDLGMYYLRARYYNPLTGRFLSVDSQAGQGQRRYEYAGADPVNGMDPSGNEAIIEFALLQFYPGRLNIHFPTWCQAVGGTPYEIYFPWCNHSGGQGGTGGTGAGPGAPGGPPPPPCDSAKANCCPQCFAELHYRSVPAVPAYHHAFWYVGDSDGNTLVIDGGPEVENCGVSGHNKVPKCGRLLGWATYGSMGHYNPDDNALSTPIAWKATNPSPEEVDTLEFEGNNWDFFHPNTPYHIGLAWNSNTFAHYLGNEAGFTNITAPPRAPGWCSGVIVTFCY